MKKTSEITPINDQKDIKIESKAKPPIPSRDYYYKKTAKYFNKALKVWVKGLKSPNENIRLGAASQIMSRILPALKAIEVTGKDGEPIKQYMIVTGNGFIPKATSIESEVIIESSTITNKHTDGLGSEE